MGFCTSAIMKIQGRDRRRLRLRARDRLPYVGIGVLFTAMRVSLSGGCFRSEGEGGMTLSSEPVSTRNCVPVCVSLT